MSTKVITPSPNIQSSADVQDNEQSDKTLEVNEPINASVSENSYSSEEANNSKRSSDSSLELPPISDVNDDASLAPHEKNSKPSSPLPGDSVLRQTGMTTYNMS